MWRAFFRAKRTLLIAGAIALAACSNSSPAGEPVQEQAFSLTLTSTFVSVYQDAMATGWSNWSWATNDTANPSPVSSGTASIAVTYAPWTGLDFISAGLSANGLDFLDLKVDGGVSVATFFEGVIFTIFEGGVALRRPRQPRTQGPSGCTWRSSCARLRRRFGAPSAP